MKQELLDSSDIFIVMEFNFISYQHAITIFD